MVTVESKSVKVFRNKKALQEDSQALIEVK